MNDDKVRIAVDAMGGDFAPTEVVKGSLEAMRRDPQAQVVLVGRKGEVETELAAFGAPDGIEVVDATEVITNDDPPVDAIMHKKDSSIVRGMRMVHDGEAAAFVSAGSTGAVLVGGQLVVGRLPGVDRAPLAPLLPTVSGVVLLIDCGANVDARASQLVQFAQMGNAYMRGVLGLDKPRVGLLNIGTETEKGNALTKETYPLLKAARGIHFIGNVEAREIPYGAADIIVTDAFAGNVVLKLYEGLADALIGKIKSGLVSTFRSKVGALLVKPAMKKTLADFNMDKYGGAPMLGLKGLVVKTHGNAKAVEITNSILQCVTFAKQDINHIIESELSKED